MTFGLLRPVAAAGLIAGIAVGSCDGVPQEHGLGVDTTKPRDDLLSALEIKADCEGLHLAMKRHAAEVRKSQDAMAEELKQPAATIERMWQRSSGAEGSGTVAYGQIKVERETMAAINARLAKKGCATMDIDRAIAEAPPPAAKTCTTSGPAAIPMKRKAGSPPGSNCT
jgi:hypothetical protein